MSRRLLVPLAAALVVAGLGYAVWAADKPKPVSDAPPAARKLLTTSKVTGSPEPPPPFRYARAWPNAKFDHPLLFAKCPGTDRAFVGEQAGKLYSLANTPDAKPEMFFDLTKEVKTVGQHPGAKEVDSVFGLVFHPKFAENRFAYVCYTLRPKDGGPKNLPDGSRVSRFKVTDATPPRIDPASEEIVITFLQGGHNGGDLHFGNDGMLYVSTGDSADPNPPDPLGTGQDCSDLLSSILRIDVDKKDAGKNYAVPKDNPFVGMEGVRPEIWAYGFRNPWRFSFDRPTGTLWAGDVGWELWEMVHKVEKGGNYGWSIVEARQSIKPDQKPGPSPIRPPTIELPHTIAASVTGGYVYHGKKFPELQGAYVFGDWETRRVWAARFDGDRVKEMPEITKPQVRMSAFGEDNAGELYLLDYDTGLVYTLERNDGGAKNANFPAKLSDTGLFQPGDLRFPADGVVPFSPNARQWQDGAEAEHYVAVPGDGHIVLNSNPKPHPGQVNWHNFRLHFPKDSVLVKTVRLPHRFHELESPSLPKPVETQLLHFDGEDWRGYTYAWREDGSDADLVPAEGGEKVYRVHDGTGVGKTREWTWTFSSRNQCLSCHNAWAEYTLAFNREQLNGRGGNGVPNQLAHLTQIGLVRRAGDDGQPLPPFDATTVKKEPAIPDPHKTEAYSLDERARGYIHANCAHCHRFGGGGGAVLLELDAFKPLKETMAFDAKPRQGDFGLADARIIAPGHPDRSVMYYRLAKFGRGRMPHLGSELPDPFGLELLNEWICSTGKMPFSKPPAEANGCEKALAGPGSALALARGLGAGSLPPAERAKVVAAVEKVPAGAVRDLFEGYLPPDPKGRKLGPTPRPSVILARTGDPANGEKLFFTEANQCAKCHKVGDKGGAVGPELSAIAKTRTKAELLEGILEPSRRIDPQHAAYLVKTADGRSLTGLLVKRDDKQVVIRDAEAKEHVLAAADVESIQPSRLSLMPEGLVAGMTPQEAADLLEYLATRK